MTKRVRGDAVKTSLLVAWLGQREDEMAALLGELVAIPTENPPGKNYRACADLLGNRLRRMGLECERLEAGEPRENTSDGPIILVASYGRGERVLYFHGHYDVVPAQSGEQFQPMRKEHFLFGRGSCDMKGGIVAMLYAILALKECGAELSGKAGLMLVPNEETEGENAFERMHRVVERLQELKREVEQRTTLFNIGAGQARNSILMLGGQSGGGANFNVVPEKCWFTVDRRINPEEDLDAEKARLLGVLEQCKHEGIPLEWEILQEGSSAACREDNPLGKVLAGNVKAVTGQAPRFEMCPGLLETRFYAAEELPAYAYGPGLLAVAHGPNEHVDLRKMIDCAAIYALTAVDILGR